MSMNRINISIPEDKKRKIVSFCIKYDYRVSQLFRKLMLDYIEKNERQR